MSQRTRGRTAGAAPSADSAPPKVELLAPAADQPSKSTAARPRASAKRARREEPPIAAAVAPEARPQAADDAGQGALLAPATLARALRAVADELDRDPALAQRVAHALDDLGGQGNGAVKTGAVRTGAQPPLFSEVPSGDQEPEGAAPVATIGRRFHPTLVTGLDASLGTGVPDPFALRERLGEDGLREALAGLRLGSLRAMVREHQLDPGGKLSRLNDAEKLRERIIAATKRRR